MLTCNSAHVPAALHRLLFHVSMEPANHTRHSQKGSGCYFTTSKSLIFNGSGPLPSNNANNLAPFKSLLLKQLSSSCFRRQTLSIAFSCKERNAGKKQNQILLFFFLIGSAYLRAYPKQLFRQEKYKLIWRYDIPTSFPCGHNNE